MVPFNPECLVAKMFEAWFCGLVKLDMKVVFVRSIFWQERPKPNSFTSQLLQERICEICLGITKTE